MLDAGETREVTALQCDSVKPVLGFDLRFQSPATRLRCHERNWPGVRTYLTIIFRVTPEADKDNPTYFSRHSPVPKIEDDAKGDAYLSRQLRLRRRQIPCRLADARPGRAGHSSGMSGR